jgi:hypothetical protein
MTDVDLKNALLAGDPDAGMDELVEIPTHAGPVVIKPLSRGEVLALNDARRTGKLTLAQFEAQMVSIALVHPPMTAAEVETWQTKDKAGGVLAEVTDKVSEISGLDEGADKSGVPDAGDES